MKTIITVSGIRPDFIRMSSIFKKLDDNFNHILIHTGQHFDKLLSDVFFDELEIPLTNYNLNVGSGNHGKQTATMISAIEDVLLIEKPNAIVLYGDTNSTLAGAMAASKIHIPVIHIEAGLRSFNKSMPEEINRIMCDHVSTLLFSPTKTGFNNLIQEGFLSQTKAPYSIDNPKIYHCGDVMYDNSLFFSKISDVKTSIINDLKLKNNGFILATIHRNNNTDEPIRLNALFKSLNDISINHQLQIVLPLHPRTSNLLDRNLSKDLVEAIRLNSNFKIISPVSFLEMLALEKNCCLVMTDSGGVQKEAFYFEKPCVILRPETEWIELLENGAALIADADENKIKFSFEQLIAKKDLSFPKLYGDGKAAEFICSEIINQITTK